MSFCRVLTEFLSHGTNRLYISVLAILLAFLLIHPQWQLLIGFFLGWGIYLPQEYLTHRFILHAPAPRNERWYRLTYRLHHGHHDLPKRLDLMYIPLWLTIPMILTNGLVYWLFTYELRLTAALLSGALCGYLFFEWCHLVAHVPYVPLTAVGRYMKQLHLRHHYRNETYWYSVSFPAWPTDWLAGTLGDPARVPVTTTHRTLAVSSEDHRVQAARGYFAGCSSGDLEQSGIWLSEHAHVA